MKENNNKKKIFKYIALLSIAFVVVLTCFAFAKYKSDTPHKIISLLTKYNVNYQTNSGKIKDPNKFNSYYSLNGLVLPVEGDITRTGHDFAGWYKDNNFTGSAITKIEKGDFGDKLFFAAWNIAEYDLKIQTKDLSGNVLNGLPDGYDIVIGKDVNGNDTIVPVDGTGTIKKIGKYQIVSIRTLYKGAEQNDNFSFDKEHIVITHRYEEGSQYIYYDFAMPNTNLTLTFSDETDQYIDISKSSIIFEENVQTGSITQDGFWYNSSIRGMTPSLHDDTKGYFYVFDNANPLYITSNGKATKNQLIVNNNLTVYMKNCLMELTDSYTSDIREHYIGETSVLSSTSEYATDLLGKDLTSYGNIVTDYTLHPDFTLNLYFEGNDNQIGSIFTNQVKNSTTPCINLHLYSAETNNKVKLGSVFGNYLITTHGSIEINEYDYSEDTFEPLFYSYNREIIINNSKINTKNKSLFALQNTITAYNSKLDVRDIFSHNTLTCRGNTYIRVRNNIYYGYAPPNLLDTSSIVVDGNIIAHYMHWQFTWATNSTGYLIVKGNRAELSSSIINNTHVICNNLVVGKSFATNNSTIITNQITNTVVFGFNVTAGEIEYTHTNGQVSEASSNSDNYPFKNYSQHTDGDVKFTFNSNIYLFGHYKTKSDNTFDETVKGTDSDNPIKPYLDKLLDENGDLKSSTELANVDYLSDNSIIINDIKNSSNTNKETIVIGNSTYNTDVKRRTAVIDGGNIYSAGNMTFFNDLIINNGYVYANGNLTSKNDLVMNNGTVEVNSLGNAYNLKKEESSNIYLYHETDLKKGIVKVNNIGAVKNELMNSSIIPKGVVTIDKNNVTLSNKNGNGKPNITTDIYINYVFNSSIFRNDNTFDSIRMNSLWNDETFNWNMDNEVIFTDPYVTSESSNGSWKFNALTGGFINKVGTNGDLLNNDTSLGKAYNYKNLKLYAVKNSYSINVLKQDSTYSLLDINGNPIDNSNVEIDRLVKLKLTDPTYINKVVIQYVDDSGVIHNVNPTKTSDTLTFEMPPADIDIYITNEMVLDLDKASYKLTNTGYIIDFLNTRDDNTFDYEGNIAIEQGSIPTASTNHFSLVLKSKYTQNVIVIDKEFNNIDSSTKNITLRKLYQYGSGASIGLKLEDGAKANVKISGPVQLFRVEVPENSSLVMEGLNSVDSDILLMLARGQADYNKVALGNNNGLSGDIYLKNMTIKTYEENSPGELGFSSKRTTATLTYDNCKMTNKRWYAYNYLGYNFSKVNILNSTFDLGGSQTWPNGLFSNVNYVNISNSIFNLTNNSSYSSHGSFPLHMGIDKELVIDNSTVTTSLREHNTEIVYKTLQGNRALVPLVKVTNGSKYITDKRIRFKKLVIDNSTVDVGENKDGYLFANDIELNNSGILNSGNVLISGFYDSKNVGNANEPVTKDDVIAKLKVESNVFNGSTYTGLVINSGTVTVKDFVGGDLNGKVVVNNGTLNAKYIGTKGALYGYGTYVPKTGEEYVYTYSKIPAKGTVVTVNNGTVNVSDNGYLGGMNAKVDIKGGNVNLGTNAILGITEEDKTKLVNSITSQGNTPSEIVDINITGGSVTGDSGYINTPYSSLNVNASMNLKDVLADYGTVVIEQTKDNYDNPLGEGNRVGVIINNDLIAQNISITNGAIVYAKNAIIKGNEETSSSNLNVDETSILYSNVYGSSGIGNFTFNNNGTIVGKRQYSIKYNMNDTFIDRATNPNDNHYVEGVGIKLEDPTRFGYTFAGWYDENNNKITEISTTVVGDKELTAHWTPKTVEFVITTSAAETELSNEEFANQVDLSLGTLNETGDKFTYNEHLYISYHDLLNTKLLLSNYNLSTLYASSAKINNTELNPDGDILNLTSNGATVTKELMEYYLNNNTPIEISVSEYVTNR